MAVGDNIKYYRKLRGLTQEELAKACGLKEITIRQYEAGKRQPRIEQLAIIAGVLKIGWDDIMRPHLLFEKVSPKILGETLEELEQEQNDLDFLNKMDELQRLLNNTGKQKAIEQVEILTEIPRYRKDTETSSDKN